MLEFLFISCLLFLIGAVIGSFLSVIIIRTIREEQWVSGGSHCDSCGTAIQWYDNIPLLSFILLKGNCRTCQKNISIIHPLVEFLTGAMLVWWYWGGFVFFHLTQTPFTIIQPLFWLLIGLVLVVILVVDLWYMLIPEQAVQLLFLLVLCYRLALTLAGIVQLQDLTSSIVATAVAFLFFFGLWWITNARGIGFGDVKLIIPLMLMLDWHQVIVGQFFAFLTGAFIGIILLVAGRKQLKQAVPFGPFLILGTVMSLVWGDAFFAWYVSLLM